MSKIKKLLNNLGSVSWHVKEIGYEDPVDDTDEEIQYIILEKS